MIVGPPVPLAACRRTHPGRINMPAPDDRAAARRPFTMLRMLRARGLSKRPAKLSQRVAAHRSERSDVRDRLRSFRLAAYRHIRRSCAHDHGAPRVPRSHRRRDQDAAHRLFRRYGRAAQSARQHPEQGNDRRPSRQAARRRYPIRSARIRASARTTTRGCAAFSIASGSITNSPRQQTITRRAVSMRPCSTCLRVTRR